MILKQPNQRQARPTTSGFNDHSIWSGAASGDLIAITNRFPVRVTQHSATLIDVEDPNDPISRQYVPSLAEGMSSSLELLDPVGDTASEVTPGLLHKYPDRVLLKVVDACATYCRFCFRRDTVGNGRGVLSTADFQEAIKYIQQHSEVWEVILSGGDPFILCPARLEQFLNEISRIDHVGCIRIHTKVPIVDPDRISDALVKALCQSKPVWVSVHCNHPRELDFKVKRALGILADAGIMLVSQTVLLRGVNNDVTIMTKLLRELVSCRVKPYYLHHLDLAVGTKQFRTSIEEGRALVQDLSGNVSGICIPTYVLDLPGGYGKVPLLSPQVRQISKGEWEIKDFHGQVHIYTEDIFD